MKSVRFLSKVRQDASYEGKNGWKCVYCQPESALPLWFLLLQVIFRISILTWRVNNYVSRQKRCKYEKLKYRRHTINRIDASKQLSYFLQTWLSKISNYSKRIINNSVLKHCLVFVSSSITPTLKNETKIVAINGDNHENHRRSNQARNSNSRRVQEDYIAQVSEEVEGIRSNKLSWDFSRRESHILTPYYHQVCFSEPTSPSSLRTRS